MFSVVSMRCCMLLVGCGLAFHAVAAPPAPTNLKAFPGGDSIAVRWDGSTGATAYRVYRDGTLVGTVTPGFHPLFPEKDGNGFIDAGVAPGHGYAYRVQAVAGGAASAMSAPLQVTFPAATTPPPSITFQYAGAEDLLDWLLDTAQPFIKTWYPKIADRIAYPDYVPRSAFAIHVDPDYDGVAATSNDTIRVSADWLRANRQAALGVLMHEFTHVIQQHAKGGWITEGMASWTNVWLLREHDPIALPRGASYFSGYSEAAYLLNWIEQRRPGFVRALNLVKHAGTAADDDPDAVFLDFAGDTPNNLWFAMTGTLAGIELRFKQQADRCLAAPPGVSGPATIQACDRGRTGQQWTFRRHGSNLVLTMGDNCLDVASSGTANGTPLQMWWDCNGSGAQDWRLQANGTLRNPQSGRCLYAPSTAAGTQLQLHDCAAGSRQVLAPRPGDPIRFTGLSNVCVGTPDGGDVQARACDVTAADQMWRVRGNGDGTLSLVVVSGECLDVQGSGTANGTPVQVWGCNGSGAQKWRLRADGALVNPQSGRCLDAAAGAVGTHLQLWACSGGAGQALALPAGIFADGFD